MRDRFHDAWTRGTSRRNCPAELGLTVGSNCDQPVLLFTRRGRVREFLASTWVL